MFENYSDNDKNYLTASFVYGSIENSRYQSKSDWWYWKRFYNHAISAYKLVCQHYTDMLNLRHKQIYPNWSYRCTQEDAEECYNYIITCNDDNFIDIVERIFHIYDRRIQHINDDKPYQRLLDVLKSLSGRVPV